ncbi:MAG: hypothetical protein A4S16_10965 [Proteobacteria bacterium SG_bin6]|nr:MAG: hypothetical protein A4S16_10965 [Proteobacteria bacterium SG_bin6]
MAGVAVVTVVLNLLLIAGSIYMMLVYDLVIPGRSQPTLFGLLAMVALAYVFQGALELLRGRLLLHMARGVDATLEAPVHRMAMTLARAAPQIESGQPLRDLDQIRTFLASQGPTALFDLPWMAFFIAILFLLHPAIGATVLVGGLVLIALTVITDRVTRQANARLLALAKDRQTLIDSARRHAEAIYAMGMGATLERRWTIANRAYLAQQVRLADRTAMLGGTSRVFRMFLQSLVLSVGALLVINDQATGGVIFASSILSSRALAPIELAIANWRAFVGARDSWQRLKRSAPVLLASAHQKSLLPPPAASLAVEALTLCAPGNDLPIVRQVSFQAKAGSAIAVLGPSGCGKSTLIKGLAGILPAAGGAVRLDGAMLDQWPREELGRHIGYLPQNAELIAGTIAQNIARFDPRARGEDIIEAARAADVHGLVQYLPRGYNFDVGTDGRNLSAGQRQRIALARALYRNPFLLLLDEPNSNLDQEGERALIKAVLAAKGRGALVILVAHRPAVLAAIDKVVLLRDGRVEAFDDKDRLLGPQPRDEAAEPRVATPFTLRAVPA